MISNYQEAREYLESFINAKVYEKASADPRGYRDLLDRMRYFLALLGHPEKAFPSVVVSGTSGKGSTAYLTADMLARAGYTTGLVTSPHLQRINERIRIATRGILEEITNAELVDLLNEVAPTVGAVAASEFGRPTYYEILSAIKCLFFRKRKVDIAVVEVGLEGKFDASNLLDPLIFVLTNISLDHTAILGNTIGKIADEATFRITYMPHIQGKPPLVITGATQPSVIRLIEQRASPVGVPVRRLGKDFRIQHIVQNDAGVDFDFYSSDTHLAGLHVSLLGRYQATNAALAVECIRRMGSFGFSVDEAHIRAALHTAKFPGRFELRQYNGVPCIIDGAHNVAKVRAFCQSLHTLYKTQKKVFLVAFKRDKDAGKLLRIIDKDADSIVMSHFVSSVDLGKNLGMEMDEMRERAAEAKLSTQDIVFEHNAQRALELACAKARSMSATLVVTGSMYFVGEVRTLLENP